MQLFQKVMTPDGEGTIVSLHTSWNGLYIDTDFVSAVVWFGVENSKNGFISREYDISSLMLII